MESSSLFGKYHDLLDVHSQSFLSLKQKAECHVKERTSRYFQRRFGDGEVETNEFGVTKPPEYKKEFSARHERFP